jgi:hypothetical protein
MDMKTTSVGMQGFKLSWRPNSYQVWDHIWVVCTKIVIKVVYRVRSQRSTYVREANEICILIMLVPYRNYIQVNRNY